MASNTPACRHGCRSGEATRHSSPPFYYWAPAFSRHRLSERLGKLCFWLIFIGFNIAFLPMHLTGLRGMPRRYGGGTLSRPAGHG